METGDHGTQGADLVPGTEVAPGAVVTPSGRVSAAAEPDADTNTPFTTVQLARLDEALTMASRETNLRFSLYLGELGPDPREAAVGLLGRLGDEADRSVVIAVSPEQRMVEIVTGQEAARQLPDRGAKLGVMSMVAAFRDGALLEGLINGLRMLADQAGRRRPND